MQKFNGDTWGFEGKGITALYAGRLYRNPVTNKLLSMGCMVTVTDEEGKSWDLYNISGSFFICPNF